MALLVLSSFGGYVGYYYWSIGKMLLHKPNGKNSVLFFFNLKIQNKFLKTPTDYKCNEKSRLEFAVSTVPLFFVYLVFSGFN